MTATTIMQRDARSGSFEAANRQTRGKRQALYQRIVRTLEFDGPATDAEIMKRISVTNPLSFTPSGVRSRRNELVLAGWVTEARDENGAPIKERNTNGSPCQVWRAVEAGEDHTPPRPTRAPKAPVLGDTDTPEHAAGLAAAKRYVEWNIGGGFYADFIVNAYLNPAEANALLDEQGAPNIESEVEK